MAALQLKNSIKMFATKERIEHQERLSLCIVLGPYSHLMGCYRHLNSC